MSGPDRGVIFGKKCRGQIKGLYIFGGKCLGQIKELHIFEKKCLGQIMDKMSWPDKGVVIHI